MPAPLPPLPIDDALPELVTALSSHGSAVLVAPPGAGKTTRVPPYLLAAGLAGSGKVVMLEPRRIAARAAARRIAEEQGWSVGGKIGYQVRFERRESAGTRILVVTEGILVQRLQADPFLEGVSVVLFDELHERNLATDLSLAMARRVQAEARPDLRLVAMSATLDAAPVAAFLGGCPVIESRGRTFPVEIRYAGPPLPGRERPLAAEVAAGVRAVLSETPGDVLVFLPGVGEIERAAEALSGLATERDLAILPLYGDLPAEKQDAVLRPGARRKVVLATNVAETSITVDGVTAVVDSGLVRRLRFDPGSGLDRLELGKVSRASAEQRAGRAGRQGPGHCLRLWTAHEQAALPPRETPEIARVDLAGTCLQLAAWGERDLAAFGWLEPPAPEAVDAATALLQELGALDAHGVTADGQAMARLPAHPRLARLLLSAHRWGCLAEAALAAAVLAERDPFPRRGRAPRAAPSDLYERLEALAAFEKKSGDVPADLNRGAARQVLKARDQLEEMAVRILGPAARGPAVPADREDLLSQALVEAFPDRLVRRRGPRDPRGVMVGGRGVRLSEESAVLEPELFLALDLDGAGAEARVRLASGVTAELLPPALLSTSVDLEWDAARERVVAWKRVRFAGLVLSEKEAPAPAGERTEAILVEAAAADLARALPLGEPEVASFLTRLECLAAWRPELGLPAVDETALAALLPSLAAGARSFAELRAAPLVEVIAGTLPHEQRRALEEEAPERLPVPSGSRIRLQYEKGKPPVLAARIQELFGLAATPRIAAGRVPVVLHLLAPNGRPQQVTQDLASFWSTTYKEVRKELAGRYPKHAWPEDPTTARPERRPGRRAG